MKMSLFCKLILHVIFILCVIIFGNGVKSDAINGPRFVSKKGHLTVKAGYNRNVTFETYGDDSFINFGPHNILHVIDMARNSTKELEKLFSNSGGSLNIETLRTFNQKLNGPHGIYQRILSLEMRRNDNMSLPSRQVISRFMFNRLRTRVTTLERQVAQMNTLLTKNECLSTPCQNGGTCLDNFNGYICQCSRFWEGPDCSSDVNECINFAGTDLGCQNGAQCINKPGSYECQCATGWFGVHCTRRSLVCSGGPTGEICGHGTCITQESGVGIKCICDQGWKTNGVSPACTVDVNECEGNMHPCSVNPFVPCINVPGAFYCGSCPSGFTGNGFYCTDIDECLFDNGGCSKTPLVQCTNTYGSRTCGSCPPGYQGNGISCSFAGICSTNNGGCHQLATCSSNPMISATYVQCVCGAGYTGSGFGPDGCSPYNPGDNANVVPGGRPIGSHCNSNPCVHGTCHNIGSSYWCICQPRYTGIRCDKVRDPCSPQPCANGGTCTADLLTTGFRCECTSHFTGTNCLTAVAACGGVVNAQEGSIIHPDTNTTVYSHNSRCAWVIITHPKKVLNVTFTRFGLEQSAECLYDWLQIHDGRNSASHMIGRYCGNDLPNGGNILSTQNTLYFWFRSDHTVAQNGFSLHWNSIDPVCGGDITTSTFGVIQSPGSPGKYPSNRDCYWKITAPPKKRIQLHFYTLQIEAHPNCEFDYLEIYDGLNKNSPILERYCNSSHPSPLLTPGPEVLLYFHTDAFNNDYGFQISYAVVEGVPGCGGVFTQDTGELTSPGKSGKYTSNIKCEYKIQLRPGDRIQLTFLTFELEQSSSCYFDYLAVYDGDSTESKLISRYCGSDLPPPITSTGNFMLIVFNSDFTISQGGFRIEYELVCRTVFTAESGIIKSPGYPDTYPLERHCGFLISLPLGKLIKLSFIDFDIEENSFPQCIFDSLTIFDGDNDNSTLVGKYCGSSTSTPPDIVSSYNYLYLEFSSDSSITGTGFMANYTSIDAECGGLVKELHGTIEFPKSGEEESFNMNTRKCRWILSAPPGFVIQIRWLSFDLELLSNCFGDYLEVYNNDTATHTSEKLGRYCGSTPPPLLTSSSNMLTLYFKSDDSKASEGFSLRYTFLDATKACGGNYFTSSGVIMTPEWPNNYPANKECIWTINAPTGRQIMLNITDFDIEPTTKCVGDYIEIRNGGYESAPLIGKYCGTDIPKSIPSLTNGMYIHFHSDYSVFGAGFKILWDSTTTGCGGVLTSAHGVVISPNYPQKYGNNAECYWKISTSAGSVIELSFADLDLESSQSCQFDFVKIYDGIDDLQSSLGTFCDKDGQTGHVISKTNHVFIRFRSDAFTVGRGFKINYNTVCNQNLTGFSGVVESPNFPNSQISTSNCTWHVRVPPGNKINASFSHFQIHAGYSYIEPHSSDQCHGNFVALKDGNKESDYRKYCGDQFPPKFISTDNNLFLKFSSQNVFSASGFRLEWVLDGCGGRLTRPSDDVESPGYPKLYSSNTECYWLIEVEQNKAIELKINDFDIEMSYGDCGFDSLTIFNGQSDTAPMLIKLCHPQNDSHIVTSSGNLMYLKFVSDSSSAGRGFKASYKSIDSKCGGKFTGYAGSIYSPNYPKNYNRNLNCLWYIEVIESHLINLTFTDFDVYTSTDRNCSDFINVYDGDDQTTPVLASYCLNAKPPVIISKSNKLLVQFTSGSSLNTLTAKGFKADYRMICGGRIVTDKEGIINSRSWIPLGGADTFGCQWTIIAERPDQRVSLTITHLEMDTFNSVHELNCTERFVEVFNGDSLNSPKVGTYCGNKIPPTITSLGNSLTVHVNSTIHNLGMFSAHYSVLSTACGGTLTSEEGSFTSPNYPDSYPPNAECTWILRSSPGNKLTIVFKEFKLQISDNCDDEYLEIRETDGVGNILGIYCGDNKPTNATVGQNLWVKFKSSSVGTAAGFIAEYAHVQGNTFEGLQRGQIASPLYPHLYLRSSETSWKIIVDYNSIIVFTFKDLEMDIYESNCFVYVAIYDGLDDSSPELSKSCGRTLPEPVKTTSNSAYIVLYTASYVRGARFLLDWISEPKTVPSDYDDRKITCGEKDIILVSNKKPRVIESPGYPHGYGHYLDCEWILETDVYNHLEVKFMDVSLEESLNCVLDKLMIYSGEKGTENWKKAHENICLSNETMADPIVGSNLMKIKFITDVSANYSGFSLRVTSVCGNSLTDLSGVIIPTTFSPMSNFRRLPMEIECKWDLTLRSGRQIMLEFPFFNITNKNDNCDNFIMLRNGGTEDSPLLGEGKYCGPSAPPSDLATSGNQLFVKFKAAYNSLVRPEQQYFSLKYSEKSSDCGQRITLTGNEKVRISSPNYPNIPNPHTECAWVIMAPASERVRVDFVGRFDFTKNKGCTDEYVEIRDGGTENSILLGRYCDKPPGTIKSTGNILYIRYSTDITDPRNGFQADLEIDICGGTLVGREGRINSPGFLTLSLIPNDVVCEWKIIGSMDHSLWINVGPLVFPYAVNCQNTSVQIFDVIPFNNTQIPLGKELCGQQTGLYRTSSNIGIVRFQVKKGAFSRPYHKFAITFNSSVETCGGTLNSPSGFLNGPNFRYQTNRYSRFCEWRITVPKGRRIKIRFLDPINTQLQSHRIRFYNDFLYTCLIRFNSSEYVESSSNKMLVFLWARSQSGVDQFRAEYTSDEPSICEGSISGYEGTIIPPVTNVSSYYCEYESELPELNQTASEFKLPARTLSLTFNNARIENRQSPYCSSLGSRISITSALGLISDVCGNHTEPVTVISPSAITTVNVIQTYGKINFVMNYKYYPCGGEITDVDQLKMLTLPTNFSGSLDCAWYMAAPLKRKLEISLSKVHFTSHSCDSEFITVHTGHGPTDAFKTTVCHNNIPTNTLKSLRNTLWIHYHTNLFSNLTKLDIDINVDNIGCGGTMTKASIINSPNFPKQYGENQECLWELHADKGYRISLNFETRFSIESSVNCSKDFVEIIDEVNGEWKSITRLCGRNLPGSFNSTSDKMRVLFRSNPSINGDGFQARWSLVCGGEIEATEEPKYLSSPGFPVYGRDLKCIYTIVDRSGGHILLNFTKFNLETGKNQKCQYDNLTLEEYHQGHDPMMYDFNEEYTKSFCGNKSPGLKRFSSGVKMTFLTDSWVQRYGFQVTIMKQICGGVINNSQEIKTLGGLKYDSGLECKWNVTAPEGKHIVVRFKAFVLEYSEHCHYDELSIYEENMEKRLATLCGNLTAALPVVHSNTNKITILFKTDHSVGYDGFIADILFMNGIGGHCGLHVNLTEKSSYDLNILNYDELLDCSWLVKAPHDTLIQMQFTQFNLSSCFNNSSNYTHSEPCRCDYLEVHDGAGHHAPLIGKYCSDKLPTSVVSSSNLMWIRFVSDGTLSGPGIRSSLKSILPICGPKTLEATNTTKVLEIPTTADGNIQHGIRCKWTLSTYGLLHFHLTDFEMEPPSAVSHRCESEGLRISDSKLNEHDVNALGDDLIIAGSIASDYSMETDTANHMFCGTVPAFDMYSEYGNVIISLNTSPDSTAVHKKFRLEYSLLGCSQNFTKRHGQIVSAQLSQDQQCTINITAPLNYTISLYISRMILFSSDCNKDYLEVRDGGTETSPMLQKFCMVDTVPSPIFSTGNSLVLLFMMEASHNHFYDMLYTTTDKGRGCGGPVYSNKGIVYSALYPSPYRVNGFCQWDITTPTETRVVIQFTVFDIGSASNCDIHYVELRSRNGDLLTKYCPGDEIATYEASSNFVSIRHYTTTTVLGSGWKAEFSNKRGY